MVQPQNNEDENQKRGKYPSHQPSTGVHFFREQGEEKACSGQWWYWQKIKDKNHEIDRQENRKNLILNANYARNPYNASGDSGKKKIC